MMALRAAKNAGMDVPREVIEKGVAYIKKCGVSMRGFSYQPGHDVGVARTGIGVLVLSLCGEHESPEVAGGVAFLRGRPHEGGSNRYYATYYCSQAMFQVGGSRWRNYFTWVRGRLLTYQNRDGSWTASRLKGEKSAIQTTAMGLIILQLPYRLLPIHER